MKRIKEENSHAPLGPTLPTPLGAIIAYNKNATINLKLEKINLKNVYCMSFDQNHQIKHYNLFHI